VYVGSGDGGLPDGRAIQRATAPAGTHARSMVGQRTRAVHENDGIDPVAAHPTAPTRSGLARTGSSQIRSYRVCKPQLGGSIPLASSTTVV